MTEQSTSQIHLDTVLKTIVEGIIIIDQHGIIQMVNPSTEKLFGYKQNELIGKTVNMLMPEPYKSEHDDYMKRYLKTGQARIIGIGRETVGLKRDGTVFPMDLSVAEMIVEDSRYFTGVIRDITERKRLEKEIKDYAGKLEVSNRDLDEFAYTASHDLKEPLRGICNYSQFLIEDYGDKLDAEGLSKLQTLINLSRRLENLINDLLFYSRLGRTEMPMEPVDVGKTVTEVVESIMPTISGKNVNIEIGRDFPVIQCNRIRLGQLLQNLISNGIKYNENAIVKIEIGWKPSFTNESKTGNPHHKPVPVIFVRDNGIGIPENHQEAVFKIFKRLHHREKFGGGTGAGLAIVKTIVEKHGGRIWMESAPGTGSTFYFTLQKENHDDKTQA